MYIALEAAAAKAHPSIGGLLRHFARPSAAPEIDGTYGALAIDIGQVGGADATVALRSLLLARDDHARAILSRG